MEFTRSDLLSSSSSKESPGEVLLRSAAYTLLESPIKAARQLVGADTSAPLLVAPPAEQEFFSAGWHAQQIGNTVGMLPYVVGIHKLVGRNAANKALGLSTEVRHSFLTGAIYGGLVTPSRDDGNLVLDRLTNATVSGLSFAAMTGTAGKMRELGFSNKIGIGLTSGIGAGLVHAEGNAILGHGRLATLNELGKDAYSFGLLGGAFGTIAEVSARRQGNGGGPAAEAAPRVPLSERVGSMLDSLTDRIAPRPKLAFAFAEVEAARPEALRPRSDAPQRPLGPAILNMAITENPAGNQTSTTDIIGPESQKVIGTRTQRPDGTVIKNYTNGTRVTEFPETDARATEQVLKDRTVTTYRNGDRVTEQPNRRFTQRPDLSTVETTVEGDTVRTVENCADGSRVITVESADGGIVRTTTRTTMQGETRIIESQRPEVSFTEAVSDHWLYTVDNPVRTVVVSPAKYSRTVVEPNGQSSTSSATGIHLRPVRRPPAPAK